MKQKHPLSRVVQLLIEYGEYKLAFRAIYMHWRVLKLHQAKLKHVKKWNKTAKAMNELHNEIALFAFTREVEVFGATGLTKEDLDVQAGPDS